MPTFVDTGFWIALQNKDDPWHEKASLLWEKVLRGDLKDVFTTDYVLDEAVSHAALHKQWGSWEKGQSVGKTILQSREVVRLVHVEEKDVETAWDVFLKYRDKKLSFTDCVSMAVMDRLGAKTLLGFNGDFDKVGRGYERFQ